MTPPTTLRHFLGSDFRLEFAPGVHSGGPPKWPMNKSPEQRVRVNQRDVIPPVQAHFSASKVRDERAVVYGGHLSPGTITFVKVAMAICPFPGIPTCTSLRMAPLLGARIGGSKVCQSKGSRCDKACP